ncbi:MAG: hypothetical protein H0V19_04190 [Euzebyales bacterium]|nr:hypothetical protein [Euzebyales bacterium]
MTEQIPGPAAENNERILARSAEGFATFPAEEVDPVTEPGQGPLGGIDAGPRKPVILIVAGVAVLFATFVLANPIPLVLGLALIVAGAAWSGLSGMGRGSGLGPTIRR